MVRLRSAAIAAAILSLGAAAAAVERPQASTNAPSPDLPRYVSLKSDNANGRHGPGEEHRIDWIYQRAGLPLQVTGESGPWRRVVDPDGAQVWIHESNLDQRRTAYVVAHGDVPMKRRANHNSRTIARLAPGVVVGFTGCDGDWRRVTVGGRVGWVPSAAVWGADCAGI